MLEYKRISDLTAAGAMDDSEIIEIEQGGISKKSSVDLGKMDTLSAITSANLTDILRISQGVMAHKKMTLANFLTALGITAYNENVDASAAHFTQTNTSKKQNYFVTSGAGSKNFNVLALASISGCRIRIIKVDTGAGVTTVLPNGAETLQGATGFPLRKQWDFIEFESNGTIITVVDSLSTIDSAVLSAAGNIISLAHGCAVVPRSSNWYLVCSVADSTYLAGEEIMLHPNSSAEVRETIMKNATYFKILNPAGQFVINIQTTGAAAAIDMTKWFVRNRYKL